MITLIAKHTEELVHYPLGDGIRYFTQRSNIRFEFKKDHCSRSDRLKKRKQATGTSWEGVGI